MTTSICEQFHIAASHPALPGHFPGDPIVPGVVLLERVVAAVERAFAANVAGLPQVKFLRPLRPGEDAELRIERSGTSAKFSIARGQELIASGTLELAP
ncbi:MAG TPA: hydroxymyristoyl-ACP dehydratase [Rudaea sp.]|jgi:3-hydroxymyristoyl/3-hydroxydecanoyl-(acyl carrier protein) dehydratase|nr:hydroxymyristoyl-ACP dehydratase [Rudaea sp.]